eukprot:CAMPEP_0117737812 /NCGR_PEP_ID=MMETSP0947-20121206/2751_1 /TAXON_ID=44440 /ORGANISM="Chattonella subsalsa, Strain CCMP2191" /LENGTH=274 /DNA_ID=CAMNT_0005553371 /DNA_START=212 /DNA_END=1036 /DNA_ORIENTATION=+
MDFEQANRAPRFLRNDYHAFSFLQDLPKELLCVGIRAEKKGLDSNRSLTGILSYASPKDLCNLEVSCRFFKENLLEIEDQNLHLFRSHVGYKLEEKLSLPICEAAALMQSEFYLVRIGLSEMGLGAERTTGSWKVTQQLALRLSTLGLRPNPRPLRELIEHLHQHAPCNIVLYGHDTDDYADIVNGFSKNILWRGVYGLVETVIRQPSICILCYGENNSNPSLNDKSHPVGPVVQFADDVSVLLLPLEDDCETDGLMLTKSINSISLKMIKMTV